MTHTDLLRQALDALELQEPAVGCPREREHWKRTAMPTMDALRAALAQPTPTPDYNDRLTTALYCGDVDELNRVLAEPAPAVNDRIHASAAPAVPDGWVMVPTHLTVDQLEAFVGHGLCCGTEPMPEAVIDAGHRWTRLLGRIASLLCLLCGSPVRLLQ